MVCVLFFLFLPIGAGLAALAWWRANARTRPGRPGRSLRDLFPTLLPGGSRASAKRRDPFSLDAVLLRVSPYDALTLRDFCTALLVTGGVGSGKTSASGRAIAMAFLRAGFGGVILCAKPGEADLWEKYCRQTGRSGDLIRLRPDSGYRFNFLDYEYRRKGRGAGLAGNIAGLLVSTLELAERRNGGKGQDPFWERATRQMVRNTLLLLIAAYGRVLLEEVREFIRSAPHSPEDMDCDRWKETSFCARTIVAASDRMEQAGKQNRDVQQALTFWMCDWQLVPEKTRGSVIATFTAIADQFLEDPIRDLFLADKPNISPEMCAKGAVIVIDLPVKEYGDVGVYAAALFKTAFQRYAERRQLEEDPRPLFLWADEGHTFLTRYDAEHLSTARSAKIINVILTQNIPNLLAALGGEQARAEADSIKALFGLRLWHANGDVRTNQDAAETIGKTLVSSESTTFGEERGSFTTSQTERYQVPPVSFTQLQTGGPPDFVADAVLFQAGRTWQASEANHLRVRFSQKG